MQRKPSLLERLKPKDPAIIGVAILLNVGYLYHQIYKKIILIQDTFENAKVNPSQFPLESSYLRPNAAEEVADSIEALKLLGAAFSVMITGSGMLCSYLSEDPIEQKKEAQPQPQPQPQLSKKEREREERATRHAESAARKAEEKKARQAAALAALETKLEAETKPEAKPETKPNSGSNAQIAQALQAAASSNPKKQKSHTRRKDKPRQPRPQDDSFKDSLLAMRAYRQGQTPAQMQAEVSSVRPSKRAGK